MYSKIQSMKSEGFTQRKVAKRLELHRSTVRKYWDMTADEYQEAVLEPAKRSCLEQHKELILSWLRTYPEVTAAQIHDWLKDKYHLELAENSVRRYVRILRIEYNLKPGHNEREYEAMQDPPMGVQMQIDIGTIAVENIQARRYQKLYCIGFVLSHSRYKYGIWFSTPPDAKDMVNAIRACFEWMGGKPKELVFDQDRLIAVEENYGDIIYTKEFETFRQSEKLDIYLCRKADPPSKGRIEAVVKYFKYNFARYRQYSEHWVWNEEFEKWLHRTGNAKKHSTTKKIPAEVFAIEQGYLTPVSYEINNSTDNILMRKIRKDNTIVYEGNRYTVPTGSFGVHEDVQLEIKDDELLIYAGFCDILLASHKICFEKGKLIQNSHHLRNKAQKIAVMIETVKVRFPKPELAGKFLDEIHTRKPRYIRDQVMLIDKYLEDYDAEAITTALDYCLINELYSAVDFKDALNHFSQGSKAPPASPVSIQNITNTVVPDVEVAKRDLDEMIRSLKGGNDSWLN